MIENDEDRERVIVSNLLASPASGDVMRALKSLMKLAMSFQSISFPSEW